MEKKTTIEKIQDRSKQDCLHNTKDKRHVKAIPIPAEDYLRNKVSKDNHLQTDDKVNEHSKTIRLKGKR